MMPRMNPAKQPAAPVAIGCRPAQLGRQHQSIRRGFTLVELLVTISIISILVSIVLFAMSAAQEVAREDRTRAQIARIDALLADKWDTYATRRLDMIVRDDSGRVIQQFEPNYRIWFSKARVDGVRELMRMELPDRKSDLGIADSASSSDENSGLPTVLRNPPYLFRAYRRKALKLLNQQHGPGELVSLGARWTSQHQGAECLYLILSQMTDDDKSVLQFFGDTEISDVDSDGMPEIVDAWGTPIGFLRWAPGFLTAGGIQDGEAPDAFDPTGFYAAKETYALYPLVFSAGPDKLKEIYVSPFMVYSQIIPRNNPFSGVGGYQDGNPAAGSWFDANRDGRDATRDNIHNHLLVAGT